MAKSPRESGKDRAARIPYNYEHQPDRLIRWRLGLTALALVGTGGWAAWGVFDPAVGRVRATHGPVARVHATWDAQCDACHVPPPRPSLEAIRADYGVASAAGDAKCQACHMASPEQAHHPSTTKAEAVGHCVACHSDHQGRDAAIIRRDDAQCTACHRDLGPTLRGEPRVPGIDTAIAGFADRGHPDFRSLKADPGRLKFNHALHLKAGLNDRKEGVTLFTLAQLAPEDRTRYGGKDGVRLSDPVQLDCAACHVADAGDAAGGARPGRSSGAYMQPIRYERHCAACHRIDLPGRLGDEAAPGGAPDPKGRLAVRHGLQPNELHEYLTGAYWNLAKSEQPGPPGFADPASLPGRRAAEEEAYATARRRTASAERLLFGRGDASGVGRGTCTECHYDTRVGGAKPEGPDPASFQVVAPAVPETWFAHAAFDHAAHRAVSCRECHAGAYADRGKGSAESKDVLIAGLDNCVRCHAPAGHQDGQPVGGASFHCLECHRYHNGDQPAQGPGALARGVPDAERREVRDFLLGVPPAGPKGAGGGK